MAFMRYRTSEEERIGNVAVCLPMGDLVMRATYTNGTEVVREFYAYDHEGRVTAVTNALGNVTTTDYDARGNAIAVDGATSSVK